MFQNWNNTTARQVSLTIKQYNLKQPGAIAKVDRAKCDHKMHRAPGMWSQKYLGFIDAFLLCDHSQKKFTIKRNTTRNSLTLNYP